ncbi:GxxExxY protein [Prevotella sp. 10(H)]|uniref:GxxExxY protein n=1 Tax=Prevotella sp. 10(H) TaxID=1158294 RepID=UPI0004A6D1AE|nr:GxxExxY protein [Prevotella sp. 10(H)]
MFQEQELTGRILKCAYEVHTALSPGLLEKVYEECLFYELAESGLSVTRQEEMPIEYKGIEIEAGYRIDLLVEDKIILELKAVAELHPIHTAQLFTYLKLSGCRIGYLINFNVKSLKDGIKRYSI